MTARRFLLAYAAFCLIAAALAAIVTDALLGVPLP